MRLTARAPRKVIGFAILCVTSASLFHSYVLTKRVSSMKGQNKVKQNNGLKDPFVTPATIPDEYLQNIPNISCHDFNYLMKPDEKLFCHGEQADRGEVEGAKKTSKRRRLLILFMIHSKAEHFEHRKAIRETWGSVGKRLTQVVFLLGNPQNKTLEKLVEHENEQFGDIIQEDFFETYRNITLKNIMGLRWASQECSRAKYVVKADDDMFVNSKLLISTLINSRLPRRDLILCKIHFFKNVPREGKYAIDKSVYSANYWPSFCFGGCWIASMDVVKRLYEMSLQTRQIYLDDVYVTGILRTKLSLPINYISRAYRIFCHMRGNYTLVREMWHELQVSEKVIQRDGKHGPHVKFWATCFT